MFLKDIGIGSMYLGRFIVGLLFTSLLLAPKAYAIVDGVPDDKDNFPFVGQIFLADGSRCSGVLLTPNVALTAAHCFVDEKTGQRQDPAGSSITFTTGDRSETASVQQVFVSNYYHPEKSEEAHKSYADFIYLDVAALVLSRSVNVPLPSHIGDFFDWRAAYDAMPADGSEMSSEVMRSYGEALLKIHRAAGNMTAYLVGYGLRESGCWSESQQRDCARRENSRLRPRRYRTETLRIGAGCNHSGHTSLAEDIVSCVCNSPVSAPGDSGGGVFLYAAGRYVLIGIINHGPSPLSEDPLEQDTSSTLFVNSFVIWKALGASSKHGFLPLSLLHFVADGDQSAFDKLGLKVRPVELSEYQAVFGDFPPEAPEGVVIEAVAENGPSAHAGLIPGIILNSISGQRIKTQQDYVRRLANILEGQTVNLHVCNEAGCDDFKVSVGRIEGR